MTKMTSKQINNFLTGLLFELEYQFKLTLIPRDKNSTVIFIREFKGQGYPVEAVEFINSILSFKKCDIYLN